MRLAGRFVACLTILCGALGALLVVQGCSQPRACSSPDDCFQGQTCSDGACVEEAAMDIGPEPERDTTSEPDTIRPQPDGRTPPPDTGSGGGDDTGRRDTGGGSGGDTDTGQQRDYAFIDVAAGDRHSCGLLDDGRVICWGSPDMVVERIPRDKRFTEIDGGWDTTCGRTRSNDFVCWGWSDREIPTEDGTLPDKLPKGAVYDVSAGGRTYFYAQVCIQPTADARRVDCYVYGNDNDFSVTGQGQLHDVAGGEEFACVSFDSGINCDTDFSGPPSGHSDFETPGDPVDLACSRSKCCAVGPDGTTKCFGTRTDFGERYDPPDEKFDMITVGYKHVCARKRSDKTVECWGKRDDEVLEQQDVIKGPIEDLAGGRSHVCALEQDGFITCWGADNDGQLAAPSPNQAARMLDSQ